MGFYTSSRGLNYIYLRYLESHGLGLSSRNFRCYAWSCKLFSRTPGFESLVVEITRNFCDLNSSGLDQGLGLQEWDARRGVEQNLSGFRS